MLTFRTYALLHLSFIYMVFHFSGIFGRTPVEHHRDRPPELLFPVRRGLRGGHHVRPREEEKSGFRVPVLRRRGRLQQSCLRALCQHSEQTGEGPVSEADYFSCTRFLEK